MMLKPAPFTHRMTRGCIAMLSYRTTTHFTHLCAPRLIPAPHRLSTIIITANSAAAADSTSGDDVTPPPPTASNQITDAGYVSIHLLFLFPPHPPPLHSSISFLSQHANKTKPLLLIPAIGALALIAAGALFAFTAATPTPTAAIATLRHFLSSSVLARSGFFAAFSLIFASEVGDKTFFIAALLAMRCGKMVTFIGGTAALAAMTVVSVAIGYAVKSVPAVVRSSEVVGQWAGAALLVYFGVKTLKDAVMSGAGAADEELEEAQESVKEAEKEGSISTRSTKLKSLVEVASLIFVAEWGDRSMLATIALGAAQNPLGVAGGAILGHAVATAIAVVGGAVMSRHISERTVGIVGGLLFLVFAVATVLGLF